MTQTYEIETVEPRWDALVEVLLTPRDGSFVDALLALADDADRNIPGSAERALIGGFQAALARRMRGYMAANNSTARAA